MTCERGFRCACFFTHNFFSRHLQGHFRYVDKPTFLRDYGRRLGLAPSSDTFSIARGAGKDADDSTATTTTINVDDVIAELEEELERRKSLASEINRRKVEINAGYSPKHAQIYALRERFLTPEFLRLVRECRDSNDSRVGSSLDSPAIGFKREKSPYAPVFSFPVFTAEFCALFTEELKNFVNSPLPKGRPNTMNRNGALLNELMSFERSFVDALRENYVQPIVEKLMPGFEGVVLDSQKAFTVSYREGEDVDLSYHYDNAEVTLNVCLGNDFTDGELYFGDVKSWKDANDDVNQVRFAEIPHVMGRGILHLGSHRHGALPIGEGERHNLILWFRSSRIRNRLCPMCGDEPELVSVEAGGDGFTDVD